MGRVVVVCLFVCLFVRRVVVYYSFLLMFADRER